MSETQERRLLAFVRERVLLAPAPPIAPDTLLFRERLLNSINILDLVAYVEGQMGRPLDEDEIVMSNFESIRAIVEAFLSDEG
jgi:acyl carrier protein